MFIDYLDPFWPVRTPEPPAERPDERPRSEDPEQPRETPPEQTPHRDDWNGYDDHGDRVDEYA